MKIVFINKGDDSSDAWQSFLSTQEGKIFLVFPHVNSES